MSHIVVSSLNAVLFWPLWNIFRSLIDSCELICLWHFIFQIHMAAQFNSLVRVEVHFVLKTMKQVSLFLEHVWTFKGSFKSSKCSLFLGVNWASVLVSCTTLPSLISYKPSWSKPWSFNKSCGSVYALQTLFLEQEPNQFGSKSTRCSSIESAAVFQTKSLGLVAIQLAHHVLQILISNLSWPKNKSWR